MQLTGASSQGINNAGNGICIRRGNRCKRKLQDGSDQNAFVYVVENVSGVVEMQKIDMPAIPGSKLLMIGATTLFDSRMNLDLLF